MRILSKTAVLLVALVAALHIAFFALEMFFWDHPIGRKIFDMTPEASAISAPLAMQQALYNGFLVAGLVWGLVSNRADLLKFFLVCVVAAGVFAALTVKPSIFFSQALPGLLALFFVWRSQSVGTGEMPLETPFVKTADVEDSAWAALKAGVETENADGFRAYVRFIERPDCIGADAKALRKVFRGDDCAIILAADQLSFDDAAQPILCIDPAARCPSFRVPLAHLWEVENNVSIGNLLLEEIVADQVVDGWFVASDA